MDYGILSCIPIAILILGMLITRRLLETMIVATFVAAVMEYKAGFFSGFIGQLYTTVGGEEYLFLLFLVLGFGALIRLFEKSGALKGFSLAIQKLAKGPKQTMVITWILGILVFIDDYLNVLAVSSAMKQSTDNLGIPREHLAYGVNSMGACVCVMVPFSSWAAFACGCLADYDMGFADYVKAIPFMFFPIIAILICLLVALGIAPKVGPLKKAYQRVAEGGPVLVAEEAGATVVDIEVSEEEKGEASSPLNFIIPIIVLVVIMVIFECDIIHGLIAAIFCQALMYIPQKLMSITDFLNNMMEGLSSMASLGVCIAFGSCLSAMSNDMGFTDFVVGSIGTSVAPAILPMLTFVALGAITFAACNFWVLLMLTMPIFVPVALAAGVPGPLVIAAMMSGVAFGSKFCFYSDAIFMTFAGTGVSNLSQIKVVAPYVLTAFGLGAICFLIAGFIFV
ncbi:MAG: Na+/H+ antiporter NhaC family protein [Lentihominibacter sp.]|nr:Na+/H+ antiporter NhaC family protein [Lentihominibacter sp.]